MKTKIYFFKALCLAMIFLAGQFLVAEAQIVGETSQIPTHDTDIGSGHNNTDVGHKLQIRISNTTLSNPASYDTYLKFNVKDSIVIPDGMVILSAKVTVNTTTNGGPLLPDFVVLHVANDNWNEDATILLPDAPDAGVEYTDTLDRTSFSGGNGSVLRLDVTKALKAEIAAEDEFMTIRVDNLAESYFSAGAKDMIYESDPSSWTFGFPPPRLVVYYGLEPETTFSDIADFGSATNYTTMINSSPDKRLWYNEIGIWVVVEDEGDARFKLNERPAPINGTPGSYALYNLDSYGDFDISMKAKLNKEKSGALDPKADFIIVFGYKDYLDYSYIRFTGEDINGFYKVDTTDGGTLTEIGIINENPAVSDTAYHNYRLVRTGSSVTAYIDGVEYMTVDDPVLGMAGKIGIGSYNDVAIFDDFKEGEGEPISVNELLKPDFKLYPNPASDVLTINTKREISSLTIRNVLGQQIRWISNIQSSNYNLNVSEFNTGIYFITVSDLNGNTATGKFIRK